MDILLIIISIITGYAGAYSLSGRAVGREGILRNIQFSYGSYKIHLHHWITGVIITIILMILGYENEVVYGLIAGITIQGLTYKDFYKIIYKKGK